MTGHDFHVEADLGDERGELILYRVARFQSFSTSDEEVRAHVEARVDHWRSVFGVDAEPEDLGDVISFLSPDAGLEVFIPSDSVWWTDRHAAFGEDRALGDDLPGEDEAADLAFGYLSELGLGHDGLYLDAVTHNETGTAGSPEDEGEL